MRQQHNQPSPHSKQAIVAFPTVILVTILLLAVLLITNENRESVVPETLHGLAPNEVNGLAISITHIGNDQTRFALLGNYVHEDFPSAYASVLDEETIDATNISLIPARGVIWAQAYLINGDDTAPSQLVILVLDPANQELRTFSYPLTDYIGENEQRLQVILSQTEIEGRLFLTLGFHNLIDTSLDRINLLFVIDPLTGEIMRRFDLREAILNVLAEFNEHTENKAQSVNCMYCDTVVEGRYLLATMQVHNVNMPYVSALYDFETNEHFTAPAGVLFLDAFTIGERVYLHYSDSTHATPITGFYDLEAGQPVYGFQTLAGEENITPFYIGDNRQILLMQTRFTGEPRPAPVQTIQAFYVNADGRLAIRQFSVTGAYNSLLNLNIASTIEADGYIIGMTPDIGVLIASAEQLAGRSAEEILTILEGSLQQLIAAFNNEGWELMTLEVTDFEVNLEREQFQLR